MAKVLKYTLDFGTSNTLLGAVTELGRVKSIPLDFKNEEDSHVLKSLIYTPSEHEWYFGNECYSKYLECEGEGRFFRSFKTLLSRESFEGTMIHEKRVDVVSLIARFLREVRHRANSFYQQDVTTVTCGRPVRFGDSKRADDLALSRLTEALRLAGFEEIDFSYEPVAALKEMDLNFEDEKNILIADIGGGTSDFSVVKMKGAKFHEENILSVGGVNVAGDDFDFSLMKDFVMPELGSRVKYTKSGSTIEHGISRVLLSKLCSPSIFSLINDTQIQEFLEEAFDYVECEDDLKKLESLESLFDEKLGFDLMRVIEKMKMHLSSSGVENLSYDNRGVKIIKSITREGYKNSSTSVIDKIQAEMMRVIKDSGVQIDLIIPIGGCVKNPLLEKILA